MLKDSPSWARAWNLLLLIQVWMNNHRWCIRCPANDPVGRGWKSSPAGFNGPNALWLSVWISPMHFSLHYSILYQLIARRWRLNHCTWSHALPQHSTYSVNPVYFKGLGRWLRVLDLMASFVLARICRGDDHVDCVLARRFVEELIRRAWTSFWAVLRWREL